MYSPLSLASPESSGLSIRILPEHIWPERTGKKLDLLAGTGLWLEIVTLDQLLLLLICTFLILAGIIFFFGKKYEEVEDIHLGELSKIWTKTRAGEVHISQLSHLWRNTQSGVKDDTLCPLINPQAAVLWRKITEWPWFEKFPLQKSVCRDLLQLQDKEGQCSSVVNVHGDVEANWDRNTYTLLEKTTLLDHSVNVAEQVVKLLSDEKAWHVIPDTMVAALAHDLGKIPSVRGFLYSLGEHLLASGKPLSATAGFRELPKKEEILQAVKLHHKRPQGLLGKTLKKADQLARQKELEEAVLQNDTEPAPATPPVPDKESSPTKETANAVWQAEKDIYGDSNEVCAANSDGPQLMDITRLFDAAEFLD